ncbi:RHS repeat-associated core domain-containing protein [uncultured Microscilla sp.]|uniref:RHS repeat-associated core domain-containing protein n=1 Tax=uncultured Microscilla sp. TaxID=432653 RepID=UPI0026227C7A|nr:RHS repeat-associated core domain-containing protein [uncultured Microscilla sp.]
MFYTQDGTPVAVSLQIKHLQAGAGQWQALELSYTATERGYLQVFAANESDQEVFFDDMVVEHTPQLIVQENHYYPFGMNLRGIEKQGRPEHRYQYNGKEKQEAFGLNWLDYGARFYDAQLGRWHGVDELSEKYYATSPYTYVLNNPLKFIDPDGKEVTLPGSNKDVAMKYMAMMAATNKGNTKLRALVSSKHLYRVRSVYLWNGAGYDTHGKEGPARTVYYKPTTYRRYYEGGTARSEYTMNHELTHAYTHEKFPGLSENLHREYAERESVISTNYMRAVYGETSMRTKYTVSVGKNRVKVIPFSSSPRNYNPRNEKITEFKTDIRLQIAGKPMTMGFSYNKSIGGQKSQKMYQIGLYENGKYDYKIYENKKDYINALMKPYKDESNEIRSFIRAIISTKVK